MSEVTDSYRNDGALINALTGLGTTKAKIENTRIGYAPAFSQVEAETLYQYGLTRRIVDAVANECTRELTNIKLGAEIEADENEILPPFDE